MGAVELRNKIIQLLNTDNVGYLKDIFEFAEKKKQSSSENDVVAFHPDGTPMTRREYKMALDAAEKQIENGDFISAEDLEKEVRNW